MIGEATLQLFFAPPFDHFAQNFLPLLVPRLLGSFHERVVHRVPFFLGCKHPRAITQLIYPRLVQTHLNQLLFVAHSLDLLATVLLSNNEL